MKEGSYKLIDLYEGAHIRVKANSFYHHGIYVGNDEVIQFGLPFDPYTNPDTIKVIKSSLKDFSANNMFIEVYEYSKKELKAKRDNKDIVKMAYSLIGTGGYNLLNNNCEHFANYCSYDVNKIKKLDIKVGNFDND